MDEAVFTIKQVADLIPDKRYPANGKYGNGMLWFVSWGKILPKMFTNEGEPNPKSDILEEYALSCLVSKKHDLALRCFDARRDAQRGGLHKILFQHEPWANGLYPSEELSPVVDKLGYRGVVEYGKLCARAGRDDDAIELLTQVATLPEGAPPVTLCDARVDALRALYDITKSPTFSDFLKSAMRACP